MPNRCGVTRKRFTIWPDASYEMEHVALEDWVPTGEPCRMGYLCRAFGAVEPRETVGAAAALSDSVLKKFLPKRQQINQCELFTAHTLIANEAECLRDSDPVWYIDNMSAAMALIKVSSAKADTIAIAVALHAIFARLGVRVWVEYVESASNPADGLSRAGLEDPWILAQGWAFKKVPCPSFFDMDTATVDSVQSIVTAALP